MRNKSMFVFVKGPEGSVSERLAEYVKPEDGEVLSRKEGERLQRSECIAELRQQLKPGDKVYSVVRKVAPSGMSRTIDFFVVLNGEMECISWSVAKINRDTLTDDGVRVQGCGMDMCFHVVYQLGRVLFPEGYGEEGVRHFKKSDGSRSERGDRRRPTTPEAAKKLVANGYEFPYRNGKRTAWVADGGYALRSSQL